MVIQLLRFTPSLLTLTLLAGMPVAHAADSVSLQGMLGNKALLIVDGGAPRTVAPGQTHQGVKVLSTSGDQAVVLVGGERLTLRVGETPASVGSHATTSGGNQIALTADSRGHFVTQGSINNRPVRFMVDTGASLVAMSQSEADRLGLDYKKGQRVLMGTANGTSAGWTITIDTLRVGDVTSYNVSAVVTPASMPVVLLGNSFLNRFNMQRTGSQMMLVRR
ncbi:retropepsin-like aspartic protease family protein [Ottowia sp.]|uniref:retropepsin-like aspartic protease family protein n=1 Tax=Ottowia sp. TaxID=1898956 RepID=UPI003A8C130E